MALETIIDTCPNGKNFQSFSDKVPILQPTRALEYGNKLGSIQSVSATAR